MAEMVAKDGESPHKSPTVGMQLGRGNVHFGEQLPLGASEGEVLPNAFENGLVEEEERLSIVGTVVRAHGFTLCTGTNRDVRVTLSPKRPTQEIGLAMQVCPPVCY